VIPRPVTTVRALKVGPGRHLELPEEVATEEPMQILVAGAGQQPAPLSVTMRTPGHDFELAAGFVVTEGVAAPHEIASVDYCQAIEGDDPASRFNHVTVHLTHTWLGAGPERRFAASSSCGICGKATIDQVSIECRAVTVTHCFPASVITTLPDRLRHEQTTFDRTGGLHAAGLFPATGALCCAREDIGRHNAVDKVVGWTVLSGRAMVSPDQTPAGPGLALAVSGRVSFEIAQKAAMAGIGIIAAVSAPSSLAIEAARHLGVTIAAFVRGETFNVYTHPERIDYSS